jgi:CheY-like chemotaxis protein
MDRVLRILVVDDQEIMRRAIRRMLRGHEVVEAGDGREALEVVGRDSGFDVILSDVDMQPGVCGIQFHESLMKLNSALARRFVFVSGNSSHGLFEYMRANSCSLVSKPFFREDLEQAISAIVGAE